MVCDKDIFSKDTFKEHNRTQYLSKTVSLLSSKACWTQLTATILVKAFSFKVIQLSRFDINLAGNVCRKWLESVTWINVFSEPLHSVFSPIPSLLGFNFPQT